MASWISGFIDNVKQKGGNPIHYGVDMVLFKNYNKGNNYLFLDLLWGK